MDGLHVLPRQGLRWNSFARLRKLGVFIVNVLIIFFSFPRLCRCIAIISLGQIHDCEGGGEGAEESIMQSPQKVGFAKGNVQLR